MQLNNHYKELRLILGDQLNHQHSWFTKKENDVLYVLMEVKQETEYVTHHIQKVIAFFAAMRQFAKELQSKGHHVYYISLDAEENEHSFIKNIQRLAKKFSIDTIAYQLPDEYRLDEQFSELKKYFTVNIADTEHFYTTREELKTFFKGKKMFLMESFYRHMRKKHNVMMNGDEPLTGKWNYDAENRKKLPENIHVIPAKIFSRKVNDIATMLAKQQIKTIGTVDDKNFIWPISRNESLDLLQYFLQHGLAQFGNFQDAMHTQYWSLFHSRLSFAMNVKMISPKEVVEAAIDYWQKNNDTISIAQTEGFVRQIIGWREYMRGIYWATMPEYENLNFFNHQQKLPSWFWTGKTNMNCLHHAITQSLDYAYAHHIQRLMITGNFALLAGIHPDEVDAWYLGIYIDAIQWVEITNTRGMSQFADGGIVGTKPYVSSANYISKMSNYCDTCFYDKNKKTGNKACPFNSLYWRFYEVNRTLLEKNPRIGMMYVTLNKMKSAEKEVIFKQAEKYLEHIESL